MGNEGKGSRDGEWGGEIRTPAALLLAKKGCLHGERLEGELHTVCRGGPVLRQTDTRSCATYTSPPARDVPARAGQEKGGTTISMIQCLEKSAAEGSDVKGGFHTGSQGREGERRGCWGGQRCAYRTVVVVLVVGGVSPVKSRDTAWNIHVEEIVDYVCA